MVTNMQIEKVNNNMQKSYTYRQQMGRYRKALANDFYFEALMIVYSVIEDRLRSFLYYIGAVRRPDDLNLNVKNTKSHLRAIYFGSESSAVNKRMEIRNISVKNDLIKKLILWSESFKGTPDNKYLASLKSEFEGCLDMGGLLQVLDDIDNWCKYRNELIHGLLNKNLASVDASILNIIEEGMEYARFIDSQVKALKKHDRIRKDNHIKR